MRVLMLAQFYPPIIGGEERFVRDFSAALAARGHEVAVATLWQEGMAACEQDGAVRVYRLKGSMQRIPMLRSAGGRYHAPPFPDPEVLWSLSRLLKREQPDIVHAHNWLIHSFLPLKLWHKAKLVVTLHDYSLRCATKKLIYRGALCSGPGPRKCLACAMDHYGPLKGIPTVLANWVDSTAERVLVDMFLPESTAVAVGNGLTRGRASYRVIPVFVPDEIGVRPQGVESYAAQLPDGEFILFVGAFGSYKGIDVLLRAYGGLSNPPPLVVVGYHTAEYPVETNNLPSRVIVLKDWPHAAVMEAFHRCSIAVAPSVWAEPFGLVVLEAMAAGKPVIASRIGGLIDLVLDGETGLLVTPGDADALRVAMQRLLLDGALRDHMGRTGKRRMAEFQAHTVLPRIEALYDALLQQRGA